MPTVLNNPITDAAAPGAVIFPRVIDNTMYSDWRSCAHRFFRRHLQGLSRGRTNVHLHFGGCIAAAFETARLSYCAGADNADAVKDACETFIERWGSFEIPDGASRTEQNKSLAAGLLAVQDYFREWPLDDPSAPGGLEIHTHNGTPCVEFSFALPIPGSRHPDTGEPIIYCGRFDMIGRAGRDTLLGLDDKTTGALGEHWRNQWQLRSQFTGYCWGAREYGVTLDGFRVRGIGILKGQTKFDYVDTPRPQWMVDRWLAQLQHDVTLMCAQYAELASGEARASLDSVSSPALSCPHPFGQNFDHACSDFSGCEFLDLCGSATPESWLSEYTVDRWNPLERADRTGAAGGGR
jgi:hypothetical protein